MFILFQMKILQEAKNDDFWPFLDLKPNLCSLNIVNTFCGTKIVLLTQRQDAAKTLTLLRGALIRSH